MNPSTPPTSTRVVITPLRPALVEEQTNVLDVLVRVQAPDAPPASLLPSDTKRALALVIDSSGSMKGRPLVAVPSTGMGVVSGVIAGAGVRYTPSDRLDCTPWVVYTLR